MLLAIVLTAALVVPPAPPGRVADYAALLSSQAAGRLEARLEAHERRTGAQMVVAIFPSLADEDLEDFSIRLAQQWRIGREGLDDGVILLVFVEERRVRFEVGYGLEPVLPDAEAGRIIRDVIAPAFRQQRYAEGVEAAVEAVYARIGSAGDPGGPAGGVVVRRTPGALVAFALLFGAVIVVAVLVAMFAPKPRTGRRGYTAGRRGWYVPTGIPPGWGGSHTGRGGFGGGGLSGRGGGGFTGGGGSFGGGGASGRW